MELVYLRPWQKASVAAALTRGRHYRCISQAQADHAGPWKDFDLPGKNSGRPVLVEEHHDQICLPFKKGLICSVSRDWKTARVDAERLAGRLRCHDSPGEKPCG